MRIVLGTLALLLVSACTSADPKSEPPAEVAPATTSDAAAPTTAVPPGQRLRAAKRALARATRGAYETVVLAGGLDRPLYEERGQFNTPALILDLIRSYRFEDDPELGSQAYTVHMRGDGNARYMRMEQWPDELRGCWLDFSGDNPGNAVGLDIEAGPAIAVPVALLLAARPAKGAQAPETLDLMTDPGLALQILGVGARELAGMAKGLARAVTPATALFSAENPKVIETLKIDGAAVLKSLLDSDLDLDAAVRSLLLAATAEVTFSAANGPVPRFRPRPEMLMDADTPEGQPCPANLE